MAQKVLLSSAAIRPQSAPKDEKIEARPERRHFSEVAGGSTAECTAIFCCCPWTVMNIMIFAFYRIPAGICRKAMNKRKRHRKIKKKYLIQQREAAAAAAVAVSQDFTDGSVGPVLEALEAHKMMKDVADGEDFMKLEEEMWDRFNQTGFWRSTSQRHE